MARVEGGSMQADPHTTAEPVRVPIVEFMVVRAPETVGALADYRNFIRDEVSREPVRTHVPPPDAYSVTRTSAIGRLVYDLVFCQDLPDADFAPALKAKLLALLPP